MRYAVTLKSKKINDATDKTYYFSDTGFTNAPAGTPANTPFSGRLSKPILSRLDMFDRLTTYGSVSSGTGEVELANPDGALDEMAIGYSFNGHEILAYVGDDDAKVFPAFFNPSNTCVITLCTGSTSCLGTPKVSICCFTSLSPLPVWGVGVVSFGLPSKSSTAFTNSGLLPSALALW